MRKIIIISIFLLFVSLNIVALAAKPNSVPNKAIVSIPNNAKKIKDGLYYLGKKNHKGKQVEGYAIFRYKKVPTKPDIECGNGICEPGENINKCPQDCGGSDNNEPDTSSCYTFLAKDAKWKSVEPYLVNPSNQEGLDETYLSVNLEQDILKWENYAEQEIIGFGFLTDEILIADTESPDDKNEVYFGEIAEPNAIAITIIWGVFSGPPPFRELIEWDQVYNQVDYDWSADCAIQDCNAKMDFENIATHELGHSAGLGDIYDSSCELVTMYGYAGFGEINKRSLEDGDINGINKLY